MTLLKAAQRLPRMPAILSLNPHPLVRCPGRHFARFEAPPAAETAAEALVQDLRRRIDEVGIREPEYRPRVVCLDAFEPAALRCRPLGT